jgi:type II secretory pathway predicted ATPase ExeA
VQSASLPVDRDMRRPPNLMKTMTAPEPVQASVDAGAPTNYLDLYGLSKPPFGGASESAGFILFGSHRRAFELLVEHMVNGSGLVLLAGLEGIGKTETLRSAAVVAAESGLRTIVLTRSEESRINLEQLVTALDGQPENFHLPPRKALLIDDIERLPQDCVRLLLSLVRAKPEDASGSPIVLSRSIPDPTRPDVAELAGLATNTIRLPPLGPDEIRQYIERSLWAAGGTTRRLLAPDVMKLITMRSGGVPGTVNRMMDAVFTAGFARGDAMITARTASAALDPVAPRSRPRYRPVEPSGQTARAMQMIALGLLVLGTAVFLYKGLTGMPERPAPEASRPATTQAPPDAVQSPPDQGQTASREISQPLGCCFSVRRRPATAPRRWQWVRPTIRTS